MTWALPKYDQTDDESGEPPGLSLVPAHNDPAIFAQFKPDRRMAERFIVAMTGSLDTKLHWFLYDTKGLASKFDPICDRTSDRVFPSNPIDTLAEVWPMIEKVQRAGGSVSVRLQATGADRLGSRSTLGSFSGGALECPGDFQFHPAAFFELDDPGRLAAAVESWQKTPPTVIVKSRRGGHAYYGLTDHPHRDRWLGAQGALATHFGGDPRMVNASAKLRLPGTWNFKDMADGGQPVFLEAVFSDARYTVHELLDLLHLQPAPLPGRRPSRPLTGSLAEAVEAWTADHGEEFLEIRTYSRCPVCDGDGGCKPKDEKSMICFSTHHAATGVGTECSNGNGWIFSGLDMARDETPLPTFLRQELDDDGKPYLSDDVPAPTWDRSQGASQPAAAAAPTAEPPAAGEKKQLIRPISEVEEKELVWVSPGWVAPGKLHIISGDKGMAKSTVMIDAIACWSRGKGWMGGKDASPANCLIIAAEDDQGDTIRPRLRAAGADLNRVFVQDLNEWDMPTFPGDVEKLETLIIENDIRFVHIDAMMSCFGAKDTHKDQDVRSAMAPLRSMCERTRVTVTAIVHLNKGKGDAVHRVMGSAAIAAIARIVILMGKDPDNSDGFIMARSGGNLGRPPKSRTYTLTATSAESNDVHVLWGKESDVSANDILADTSHQHAKTKANVAINFLIEVLGDGALDRKEVLRLGAERGISKDKLKNAARAMGLISIENPGGRNEGCKWLLPSSSAIAECLKGISRGEGANR